MICCTTFVYSNHIKMYKIIYGIIFCLLFTGTQAQNRQGQAWTITGKVVDRQTGEIVEYTNVLLYKTTDSVLVSHATSQADGTFTLECSKIGDYYLSISFVGYEKIQIPLLRFSEKQKLIALGDIQLGQSRQELSEVEVVGQKRQIVYKLDKRVIDASGYISAAGGTAVDILEQTPSIRVDAQGELTFRGSTGFKVYVDGKPSTLEGTAALEQIPAGQIENIEVITTPSAKHDPDGSVGIININTKKQAIKGWSGMVNTMASSVGSLNLDFQLSRKTNQLQWQVAGYASRRYRLSDFDQTKEITMNDTLTSTHSTGKRKGYYENYSLRSGFDLYKKNTTWTVSAEGGYRGSNRGGDLHYEDLYQSLMNSGMRTESLDGSDFVDLHEWFLRGDAGFDHRFERKGHKLTGSFYLMYGGDALEYFQTDLYNSKGGREQGHKAWEDEFRWTSQGNLDYVYPLNDDDRIETGYQFYSYTEDGDYTIDMYNPSIGQFVRRDDLYNKYLFRRDIHSLYTMWSNSISQFKYQLGLRGEYTHEIMGDSEEWAEHVYDRFELFPSTHLAYTLPKEGRISIAYSRRTTRPQLFFMEPYVVYVDYYTAQQGNPAIRPEYINSMEGGYNKSFGNNTLTATLFHRMRKDKIERIRVPYHTGVTLDSMANVGNDYSTGAELSSTIQFKRWWNMDANGSLYYYKVNNDYKTSGQDGESWNWQLAINNNFDLGKNTRMRLEGYYVGPSVSTQGRVNDFFYVNLTIRQQLFNRHLAAGLSIRNILSTAKYVSTQSTAGLESLTKIYPRSPLVTLTVSYTFNNFKSKSKEEQNSHDMFEGSNR